MKVSDMAFFNICLLFQSVADIIRLVQRGIFYVL